MKNTTAFHSFHRTESVYKRGQQKYLCGLQELQKGSPYQAICVNTHENRHVVQRIVRNVWNGIKHLASHKNKNICFDPFYFLPTSEFRIYFTCLNFPTTKCMVSHLQRHERQGEWGKLFLVVISCALLSCLMHSFQWY